MLVNRAVTSKDMMVSSSFRTRPALLPAKSLEFRMWCSDWPTSGPRTVAKYSAMSWLRRYYSQSAVQCADNYNYTDCYISETSQPLCKRLQQHTSGSSVSAVFDHLKASGHKTDLEEVKIIDRETRLFERRVNEAIWMRAENPSLNRSGGVRIKLSHAWDRTIRTLPRKLTPSSTSDDVTSGKSPESRSTTSVPSWRVVVTPATSVCSEKRKSGWKDLILTHKRNVQMLLNSMNLMDIIFLFILTSYISMQLWKIYLCNF